MTQAATLLQRLADLHGIEAGYTNIWGEYLDAPEETLRDILRTFGHTLTDERSIQDAIEEVEQRQWTSILDPVKVAPLSSCPAKIFIRIPKTDTPLAVNWAVTEEGGKLHKGGFSLQDLLWKHSHALKNGTVIDEFEWTVPVSLNPGYHLVSLSETGRRFSAEMALIVAPDECYIPQDFEKNRQRAWGPAVQLYAFRSKRNWGIGDFTDLKNLMSWCAGQHAGLVGVNPLHELFPHQPRHISPYSPSSRSFFNTLYLDIEAMEDFQECEEVRAEVLASGFREKLAEVREVAYVDYEAVAALKRPLLERLFRHFQENHLDQGTPRDKAFAEFVGRCGRPLEQLATFQALHEHFYNLDQFQWAWQTWPKEYRDPRSTAVAEFAAVHRDRVRFFQYLQWQTDRQLQAVRRVADQQGMPLGLYMDLAVGSDISGAEVWLNQELFALEMSVGAPPDECNQKGQSWGLPPYMPEKLRGVAYAPFIRILRQNMRHSGALRLDHVMGLMRLFWIPQGKDATHGAYVHYPFDDLLGILALESQRNRCLVIGEDLGTVPELVEQRMAHWKILSYKVFYFERHGVGAFRLPADYPAQALVALSTHDLPTLAGFWSSEDIRIRTELDLYPNEDFRIRQIKDRSLELTGILDALKAENLLASRYQDYSLEDIPDLTTELAASVHAFLARTPCHVMMVQLEDVFDEAQQVNLPGTVSQYPNWQRKIIADFEDWNDDPRMKGILQVMKTAYGELVPS